MNRMNQAFSLDQPTQPGFGPSADESPRLAEPELAPPTPQERLSRIVRTIEQDIIPRLIQAHREPIAAAAARPALTITREEQLQFLPLIVSGEDADWQGMIETLRVRGLGIDEIYLGLLAPVARDLGVDWEEDRRSFTDVTVAMGRMQRVMRTLSPAFGREVQHPVDGRRVLLLPAPGEQHTFGLSIVAEFFRRSGWEVVGDTEASATEPAALVRREWFDVIGISAGIDSRLDWLTSGIAAVRNASRNRAIGVMVGGPVFVANPERAAEVGADGTAVDGRQAPLMAEQLLEQRLQRL